MRLNLSFERYTMGEVRLVGTSLLQENCVKNAEIHRLDDTNYFLRLFLYDIDKK